MPGYRVTGLRIKNFGRIESVSYEIGLDGAVFAGRNMAGKTSHMLALEVLLQRVGVADAVRHIHYGAGKAELFLELIDDLGHEVSVARSITANGAQDPRIRIGEAGLAPREPRTWLEMLIGRPALDPLAFWRADAKRQRALLLEALPIVVTAEELRAWAEVPAGFSVAGHGLEVVARLRDVHYGARTGTNGRAKAAETEAVRLEGEAATARAARPAKAPVKSGAIAALEDRKANLVRVTARREDAGRAATQLEATRTRVARIREMAVEARAQAAAGRPSDADVRAAERADESARIAIEEHDRQLEAARNLVKSLEERRVPLVHGAARAAVAANHARDQAQDADDHAKRAERLDAQALELEATLAAIAPAAPSDEDLARAREEVDLAAAGVRAAEAWDAAESATARAMNARLVVETEKAAAAKLDGFVDALTHAAPAALLAKTLGAGGGDGDFLSGISLEGEHILVENGEGARVRLDVLSGAERMRFAVDLAKRLALRANAQLKVFLIHELEAVDEESRRDFLGYLVEGGWQVLAACVARSDRDILGRNLEKPSDLRLEPVDALLYEEAGDVQ